MEQYLRRLCNYEQDHSVKLLPRAEFAYHKAIHASTRMTPLWANYHYHPVTQFTTWKHPSSLYSEIKADNFAAVLEETHQTICKNLQEAAGNHTNYAGWQRSCVQGWGYGLAINEALPNDKTVREV
jgi:hypothetical protein